MGAVEEGGGHTGECLSASLDVTQENAKLLNVLQKKIKWMRQKTTKGLWFMVNIIQLQKLSAFDDKTTRAQSRKTLC